jgi:hypothetical protein
LQGRADLPALPIAPSTYNAPAAKRADPAKRSARKRRDTALQADIRRVWNANFQVSGVREVWRQLRREAIAAPRCQVAPADETLGAGPSGARQDGITEAISASQRERKSP